MKPHFVFLILHYITIEETKKCVESIINKVHTNYDIIIVDNNSKNGTGEELKKFYSDNSKVRVLINKKNLGFSKGNNVGFKYIKENMQPDFIIMINNDTEMIIDNFCEIIEDEYNHSHFAVLGPRILLSGNRIDDCKFEIMSIKKLKLQTIKLKIYKAFNYIHLYFLCKILKEIANATVYFLKNMYILKDKQEDKAIRKENVLLQGACLIFSKEYIDKFEGIVDKTYLYREEDFLLLRLRDNNLKSVYNPYLIIYHEHSASTSKEYKSRHKKLNKVLKNMIESNKMLINELTNKEKK